jgi:hypothetical protein
VWEELAEKIQLCPIASLYKTKVVPFEKLILKSVNKIKIGQFLTKL